MKVREETDPLGAGHGQASWRPVVFGVWTTLLRGAALILWKVQRQNTSESLKTLPQGKQLRGLTTLSLEKERRLLGGMRADFNSLKCEVSSSRGWIRFIIKLSRDSQNVCIYKALIWPILTAHRFCARHCPRRWAKGLCLHEADTECITGKTVNTQVNREEFLEGWKCTWCAPHTLASRYRRICLFFVVPLIRLR